MTQSKKTITCIFSIFTMLLSCTDEMPDIDPVVDSVNNEACSKSILYNVKDFGSNPSNYKIAVSTNGVETILVEDKDFNFWWARLHPNKSSFVCYKSPAKNGSKDNDYSNAELWKFNIDGSNGVKLIDLEDYGWNAQGVADWSPNGKHLIMAADYPDDPDIPDESAFQIVRTDADGKNPKALSSGKGLRVDPAWSNDGKKIVYSAFPDDYDYTNIAQLLLDILFQSPLEIHIADVSEEGQMSNVRRITNDKLRDNDPYFSNDDSYIAWESFVDGHAAIRAYDIEKNEVNTIMDVDGLHCCPSWYDDPNRFLIHSIRFGTRFYIAEFDKATQEYKELLIDKDRAFINPQWVCWPN